MSNLCPRCGANLRPNAQFCGVCGAPASAASLPPQLPPAAPPPTQIMPAGQTSGLELVMADGTTAPLYPVTTIGRDQKQCNLVLAYDDQVSRVHATLEDQGGDWILTDLGSSNGTHLNGFRLTTPVPVQPGEIITIGNTMFTIHRPGDPLPSFNSLALQQPQALTPAGAPPSVPSVPGGLGGPGVPDPWGKPQPIRTPPGGWRTWDVQPLAEGIVQNISDRYMMRKNDLLERGCMGAMLALISPALIFLVFLKPNDVGVRDVRLLDAHTGFAVDVKVVGELHGNINLGDSLAIWGKEQRGQLIMQRAFNYATNSEMRVEKM